MTGPLQPRPGAAHARILGVGGYRPSRVVTNDEICEQIDSTDEWIRQRTGIITRHFAAPDETVVDMSAAASEKAIAEAGLRADQLDAVIVATVTHLSQTPSAAAELAFRLGTKAPAAFDISAACAGFSYGLTVAQDMIRGGSATHVLVVGVEKLSDMVDPTDRSVAFIFGDGAGAAVVGPSAEPGIGAVVWGSDGGQADAIRQDAFWTTLRDDPSHTFPSLKMKGPEVFRWAVYEMSKTAQQALDAAGITGDQLDAFIPHQANMRITDAMIKQLGLPDTVAVARDIAETGNTSAASIPLAMSRMLESGEAKSGDLALLIGFGAGLVYSAQVVVLP
ncbi:MAG TPA: beta-ketoacyl-ACP synthase III [Actinomycetes bacterium]|nr:beta-ketoacyl-ACP synthase III [Actinomycetes bacterium]